MKSKLVYFDNASTTPIDERVFKAMLPYFKKEYGNPSNLYEMGRNAKRAIQEATEKIAKVLHCRPDEFIFTGSATEADNLAIAGVARANKEFGNKIIVSSVEHKGILAVCENLKKEGFEIVKLPVGKDGIVDLEYLKKELDDKTILVSVTMADSETGTLQPIFEIAKIISNFKNRQISNSKFSRFLNTKIEDPRFCKAKSGQIPNGKMAKPFFHTDASQAASYLNADVQKLGVDIMTLSAHKMHGPKGSAGLYVKSGVKVNPIIFGGGQQGKLRSGTENVPAIVGFGEAFELNQKQKKSRIAKLKKLRDKLEAGIFKSIPKVILNGHSKNRLPNFLNISILDVEGEALLLYLDELGIMVNTGSACNSESLEPSYVLTAIGNPYEFVHGSIRFSLSSDNTVEEVNYVLKNLPKIVAKLRKISPLDLSLNQKESISDKKAFVGNQMPHFLRKPKSNF